MYKYIIAAFLLSLTIGSHAQQQKDQRKDTSANNLNEVQVSSRYYRNYKPSHSSNTLKLNTPLLALPQNIQVIDKSVILDQQSINVTEGVTRNVSGALRNNSADFYGPLIFMRGAAINTLRNGVDLSMIYYGPMPEDAAIIDRMEFIKGPAGFMNAIGDPAGSFNIVTKSPTGTNNNTLSLSTGSFNLYRLTGDFDGNLDRNKKWQYRLNVVGQKAKSFQKFAFNDKLLIDPVLRYNINSHSSITAEYIYQKQEFLQYLLTVFTPNGFGTLPRDFSIADPGKDPVKASENNGFVTYNNVLNDNWQFTARATFAQSRLDGNYFFVSAYNPANPSLLQRRVTYEKFKTGVYAFQAYLNGQFNTGFVAHKLVTGIDANRKELLAYSGYNDKTANQTLYPLDVNNPVYNIDFDDNRKVGDLESIATNKQAVAYYAGYVQDELSMFDNKLRLTLAARMTSSKSSIKKPTQTSVSDAVFTPRAGLSYSILKDFSIYGLYDQTFTPQSGISVDGGVFDPLKGKNIEAGLKKDWAEGKWNTTLSLYHITRDNIIVTDPQTNLQSQIGQTKSKGIEFDAKGEIVKGLNVIINYAYTDSYISKDANPIYIGRTSPYRVKHIQNTWVNYRLPFQALRGVTVSGGYQFQAGRSGRYYQDSNVVIGNIFRVDAGLGWSNQRFSVNGIVNNVFNRLNYGSAWTRPTGLFAYVPFPPTEARLTLGYSF